MNNLEPFNFKHCVNAENFVEKSKYWIKSVVELDVFDLAVSDTYSRHWCFFQIATEWKIFFQHLK